MSEHTPAPSGGERDDAAVPGEPDRYARARGDEEPGAHSGGESQARSRVVPGTASAGEGYRTHGGTAEAEPLAGVERTPQHGASGPVTPDHLRELLGAPTPSVLALLEGRAQVLTAEELRSDRYAGALEIITGEELGRRIATDSPSDQDLDGLAATLNSTVTKLGA
ncbi:hypothetical protein [Streptomyces sp. NPDC007904]|jgi:hypothetical protein|uniref:hypothetical protein n=1 Tax=Streptomyces sp. NPDC007904 TaxID=3364787 RepID=UPI0036E5AEAE